mgnify:CR=1 FL=1
MSPKSSDLSYFVFIRYAREDSLYLLHIYDFMSIRLLSAFSESENSDVPPVEV